MAADAVNDSFQPNFGTAETDSFKNVPYYLNDVPTIPPLTRTILEEYSHIDPDKVKAHVAAIRARAFAIKAYPCIGLFRFLSLGLPSVPIYPEIVARLKTGQVLLDLGCCFGQELRPLVREGVPSENLYGADLRPEYWDMGYDLFADRDSLKAKFLGGDIFDDGSSSALNELDGKVDIIYAGSFFHLFSWDQQFLVAKKVIKLLKPVKGSMIVGRHMGKKKAAATQRRNSEGTIWRHDEESWGMLWRLVGNYTDTKWDGKVEVVDFTDTEKGYLKKFGEDAGDVERHAAATRFSFQMIRL